jgi:uncharacterized tellurite resistance protein B-like protein
MILAILGAIITVLILLNRLADAGIDLGGLNPFLWNRRRKWRKKYDGDPIFKITDPMEATALLMLAIVKADGDITKEDKQKILSLFESDFNLSKKEAISLLISSTYIHNDGSELKNGVKKILQPSLNSFSDTQAKSAISLIKSFSTSSENSKHISDEAEKLLIEQINLSSS